VIIITVLELRESVIKVTEGQQRQINILRQDLDLLKELHELPLVLSTLKEREAQAIQEEECTLEHLGLQACIGTEQDILAAAIEYKKASERQEQAMRLRVFAEKQCK